MVWWNCEKRTADSKIFKIISRENEINEIVCYLLWHSIIEIVTQLFKPIPTQPVSKLR